MKGSSWIRKMFTQGLQLKKELGAENVADLALGNPVQEPPKELGERLKALAGEDTPGLHRYMPNGGFKSTRMAIADYLRRQTGVPYESPQIVMTVGAGGGLNVIFKSVLDAGDEVIVLAPFFVEYKFYITNHGGRMVLVDTDESFQPDPDAIRRAITRRTRAVVINAPNNPTGVVYPAECLDALADVLREASKQHGHPIYLVSDEPYRAITYDGVQVPWPVNHYRDTLHVTSFSKDLGIPGERIGYVAINHATEDSDAMAGAMSFANRTLGFVNAPALQQRLVEGLLDVHVDLSGYAAKREMLLEALDKAGYDCVRPMGAFYIFPKVPDPDLDDVDFVHLCLAERMLVVPGSGFGRPGYFRMSYAVTDRDVELAVDALQRVANRIGAGA